MTFLRTDAASEYLTAKYGFPTANTLTKYRCTSNSGPKFRMIGRFPVYLESDLDAWAESRMSPPVHSSSELSALAQAGG